MDDLAAVFDMIATLPSLGREWTLFDPPVRTHVHRQQLIVYRLEDDHLAILRLLGGAQDWISILAAADRSFANSAWPPPIHRGARPAKAVRPPSATPS
ncbi:type II toxin-antitoxin system RelE/ParE family toxin [Caulobacter segnis]|uniref:type II toxin-antitoxin system RelE/ParE family toxin n=1 Tax=Caulobacter segnis TaxID=88688 RepID=UPI003D68BCAA